MSKELPILIIGTGPGGLSLAQSLKQHDIPFQLFERDSASDQRAQGYRIRINEGLREALPPHVYQLFEETCGVNKPPVGRFDARTGEAQEGFMGGGPRLGSGPPAQNGPHAVNNNTEKTPTEGAPVIPTNTETTPKIAPNGRTIQPNLTSASQGWFSLPADRRLMRKALATDLESYISYNKQFTQYTTTPGNVTAHFADGTSYTGRFLVGADGVYSKVARQLTNDNANPYEMKVRALYGKTPITPVVERKVDKAVLSGMGVLMDSTKEHMTGLFFEPMRFTFEGAPADYLYWVMIGEPEDLETTESELMQAKGDEAKAITMKASEGWKEEYRAVLEYQDTLETATLKMKTSDPTGLPVWESNAKVTVIGDSIHAMPPTGGAANVAIQDAIKLSKMLVKTKGRDITVEDVRGYEDEMRESAGTIVSRSYGAVIKAFGARPLEQFPLPNKH